MSEIEEARLDDSLHGMVVGLSRPDIELAKAADKVCLEVDRISKWRYDRICIVQRSFQVPQVWWSFHCTRVAGSSTASIQ